MKFELRAKCLDVASGGKNIVVLNVQDAKNMDVTALDRVATSVGEGKQVSALVDTTESFIQPGEIGLFAETAKALGAKAGGRICVEPTDKPASVEHIKAKIAGEVLTSDQMSEIVNDVMADRLSEIEATAFLVSSYIRGLNYDEILNLTRAIIASGTTLDLKQRPIMDKHCLPYDTPVPIRVDGQIRIARMGEVVDSQLAAATEKSVSADGAEFAPCSFVEALVFDKSDHVGFAPVTGVHKYKSPEKLYEITLQGNRRIQMTEDHSIFVLQNGKITNVAARDLTQEDFIIVPTKADIHSAEESINIFDAVDCDYGSMTVETSAGGGEVQVWQYKGRCIQNTVVLNEELMRLLGYYVSEGFTNSQGVFFNFGSHEHDLIIDTMECVRRVFGIEPTINRPHETAVRVCVYNKLLSKVFNEVFDCGQSALEKKIPHVVWTASDELKKEFVRTLIAGDGYVRRGYEAMYATSSKQLALELTYLLSLLGLSFSITEQKETEREFPAGVSKIQKAYSIYTQARELFGKREKANVSFINLLPISQAGDLDLSLIENYELRRSFRRQKYVTKEKARRLIEVFKSPDARRLINGDLGVLKVKKIQAVDAPSEYVYDFEVQGHALFAAGFGPMFIHNCLGGVPGNRTTMIIVPIVAAAGLTIPKTSSRSITSPAGTADTMSVLCRVDLTEEEITEIVNEANGCIAWGGAVNLAAADDKLIRLRHPLSLDPPGVMIASILAKKKAVGATHVLIDLPMGKGCKVVVKKQADALASDFILLGSKLGMEIECIVTPGYDPIGAAVGPALEAREVLRILNGEKVSAELTEKSLVMSGILLEMGGACKQDQGRLMAQKILESGRALEKMRQIIHLQGGNPNMKAEDVQIGTKTLDVTAREEGRIHYVNIHTISAIARAAGAPHDLGAGIYLYVEKGDKISKGDKLFTIFAESQRKLEAAREVVQAEYPIELEKIILGKYLSQKPHLYEFSG